MEDVERLMSEYQAASTSVERGDLLTKLAIIADDTSERSLILLAIVNDETEGEDLRALALDCFSRLRSGQAPPELIETCHRLLTNETRLKKAAKYVLRKIG